MSHHDFIDLGPFLDPKKMSTKKKLIYPNHSLLTLRDGLKSIFKDHKYPKESKAIYKIWSICGQGKGKYGLCEGYWVPLGSEEP